MPKWVSFIFLNECDSDTYMKRYKALWIQQTMLSINEINDICSFEGITKEKQQTSIKIEKRYF